MANIFPANGGPRQGVPFGMPDMYSGRPIEPIRQPERLQAPRIQQISQSVAQPQYGSNDYGNPNAPNVVYRPPASDSIGSRILGPTLAERELIQQKQNPALLKQQQNSSLALRKQILAEKVASGKATDEEKHQHALDLEEERQEGRLQLQGVRDTGSMSRVNRQGELASDRLRQTNENANERLRTQGDIRSRQITEQGNQSRLTQDNKPVSASEIGNQQDNTIRQLMITRPDLAQYIEQDTGGRMQLKPDAPLEAVSQIERAIYSPARDIPLPSGQSNQKVITQRSPSTGKVRTSTDGGKTWVVK